MRNKNSLCQASSPEEGKGEWKEREGKVCLFPLLLSHP